MRVEWNYIKLFVLIVSISVLYGFSDHRAKQKPSDGIVVEFVGNTDVYLTEEAVNKLLIQNFGPLENRPKEQVVLDTIEEIIRSNPMVKSAHVFFSVDGELISQIVQREPIGRVEGVNRFYLDDEGKRMPLSKYHSARVPIITGKVTGKSLEDAYVILNYIYKDDFLKKNVIGIHIKEEGDYQLKMRVEDFVVDLGNAQHLEEKFKNFMAFYVKAAKDKTLEQYAAVSLKYDNQVVCTKI